MWYKLEPLYHVSYVDMMISQDYALKGVGSSPDSYIDTRKFL